MKLFILLLLLGFVTYINASSALVSACVSDDTCRSYGVNCFCFKTGGYVGNCVCDMDIFKPPGAGCYRHSDCQRAGSQHHCSCEKQHYSAPRGRCSCHHPLMGMRRNDDEA